MKTIAIVRENKWVNRNISNYGWGNGYVAVPKEHPLFGMDYDSVLIDTTDLKGLINVHNIEYNDNYKTIELSDLVSAHGGLTMSGSANDFTSNDSVKKYPLEFLDNTTEINWDNYWIFGFDTCHCYDNERNCNKDYVIRETLDLQEQLESITEESILEELNK